MIDARAISKDYSSGRLSFRAVDNVTVKFGAGAFVCICGPSGSGKSTLLNLLGCLERPSSGEVRIAGTDFWGLPNTQRAEFRNRTIGYVFQEFCLIPQLSALDNVALPLRLRGLRKEDAASRARKQLETVGLEGKLNNRPSELSGGQQQRVAIARALVTDPRALLADEPTGNLDTQTGVSVLKLLERCVENGVTVVVATHDSTISSRSTRIVKMLDGRVIEDLAR